MIEQARLNELDPKKKEILIRDGKKRREMGVPFIRISKHGTSCDLCKPFESKVLIDDIFSGGKQADGNYMLLSQAIKCGLFHNGCRHGCATFFPDMETDFNRMGLNYTEANDKVNDYGNFKKCPQCGKRVDEGNYCPDCGSSLRFAIESDNKKLKPKQKKKKVKKGCLTAILIILALIILMIVSGVITFE